jgi:hypothetical protein
MAALPSNDDRGLAGLTVSRSYAFAGKAPASEQMSRPTPSLGKIAAERSNGRLSINVPIVTLHRREPAVRPLRKRT